MDTFDEQEDLYRIQLLQAFGIDVWIESKVTDMLIDLWSLLYLNTDFMHIINKASKNENIIDILDSLKAECTNDLIFTILFKYEYFDLMHSCIADVLMHGAVHPIHLENMMKAL
jgi:hypothetical protein